MSALAARFPLINVLKTEFAGYGAEALRGDIFAGITVGAVALPLALGLGLAAGASAAAGLVTSVLAGFIIGGLGGAGYQISGASGSMSAVLIVLATRFGMEGVWMAGVMAGMILLIMGIFNLGQVVNFIPSAVISGFTSGIALIIFIGQIDNLLGVHTAANPNALLKLLGYFRFDYRPDPSVLAISASVIAIILLWPASLNKRLPGTVVALIATTVAAAALKLDVPTIGEMPKTILLDQRLTLQSLRIDQAGSLIGPAFSIAALCAIESLLCGTVGGRMVGRPLALNQELIAQGIGNMTIPFFGGIPAAAVIARTSVAIKSGGRTRVVSFVHSGLLLLAVLTLAPQIGRVPLASLAGVLAITAYRINEWDEIRNIFGRRFKSAMIAFTVTMVATIALDLTQAIIIGFALSALIFVYQISRIKVEIMPVSEEFMQEQGYEMKGHHDDFAVVNVTGPLFFGSSSAFNSAIAGFRDAHDVILNLRFVPMLDTTGIAAIEDAVRQVEARGGRLYMNGLTDPVREYLERSGLIARLGEDRVFWSTDQAIIAADRYRASVEKQKTELAPT